jgi:RsiW-degrading membrane proteinase PrsW (M82 family)
MNYPIYIFFGLAPSVIWLLFYLRKDSHPESNGMILKIFFWGMLAAVPVALLELGFAEALGALKFAPLLTQIIYVFLGIALIEEGFKYFVVRKKALRHHEFDEPVDITLYMIIAALGFAASENLLILFPSSYPFQFMEIFLTSGFRFVGATFLHALCSGVLGYFLAISFCEDKRKLRIFGFILVIALHGLYDFSIIRLEGNARLIAPVIILMILAGFLSFTFKELKKLKSVCHLRSKNI